ncbi:sulfotransferase [Alteromonas stellipolaris]|uniref:sulfotransferase n=1 Tax=Alteromonas stellipolaris TaxID=233316 RepID=UPI0010FE8C92|nr:sulfotransferase [Alteromonas stellipolaris]
MPTQLNPIEVSQDEVSKYSKLIRTNKYKYPLRRIVQKRKFHAFCLGTPKSGTHSVANILSNFRSYHEINDTFIIAMIYLSKAGLLSDADIKRELSVRDRYNWLEMDSSHYYGQFPQQLIETFANAKYVLTIRDCISWIDSWFNHQLARDVQEKNSLYDLGRTNYYDRGFEYTKYDEPLRQYGLFPLASYFQFWAEHNNNVLTSIPKEQLLIIKTKELGSASTKLASFLNIEPKELVTEKSHSFKAKEKLNILQQLDKSFVRDTATQYCESINNTIFPEAKIVDAIDKMFQK